MGSHRLDFLRANAINPLPSKKKKKKKLTNSLCLNLTMFFKKTAKLALTSKKKCGSPPMLHFNWFGAFDRAISIGPTDFVLVHIYETSHPEEDIETATSTTSNRVHPRMTLVPLMARGAPPAQEQVGAFTWRGRRGSAHCRRRDRPGPLPRLRTGPTERRPRRPRARRPGTSPRARRAQRPSSEAR